MKKEIVFMKCKNKIKIIQGIFFVSGYAKPFAHITMGSSGTLPPPPSSPPPPWSSRGPAESSSRLLETSLDDDDVRARMDTAERVRLRSRSMGQILETNFDGPNGNEEENGENLTAPLNISHSRSLGGSGFMKLSLGAEPLETDM
jgi:hypothetical protein